MNSKSQIIHVPWPIGADRKVTFCLSFCNVYIFHDTIMTGWNETKSKMDWRMIS